MTAAIWLEGDEVEVPDPANPIYLTRGIVREQRYDGSMLIEVGGVDIEYYEEQVTRIKGIS